MGAADELPELAIQRIQSFLPTKEAARSCLLSKSWLRSFSTHPSLHFDQSLLFGIEPLYHTYRECYDDKYPGHVLEQVRTKFVDYVNNTLHRYTTQKLRILKFGLCAPMLTCKHHSEEANADIIDEWIRVAIESGTNELHLSLSSSYTVPETVLFSAAKSLQVLVLSECNFRENHDDVCRIDFCNLKSLVLEFVYIDDHTIASLISGIPLVENISLTFCTGFTRIKVSSLHHLKLFYYMDDVGGEGQILDIELAPNLESLRITLGSEIDPLPLFNTNAFSKLKELSLDRVRITDMLFNDLVPQFKVIKQLSLSSCNELESINISGGSLEMLDITYCRKLVAATVDAPKLHYFFYYCDNLAASVSVVNYSQNQLCPLRIHLIVSTRDDNLNTSWFLQLRGFLKNINHKVLSLTVYIESSNQNCFSSANLDPSQADSCDLIEVEDLRVNIEDSVPSGSSLIWYPALLDGLFWSSHPTKTLTIDWRGTNSDRAFTKFLKSLMDQNSKIYWSQCIEDGEYLSSCLHKKTRDNWWYYLKDAENWSWDETQFTCDLRRDL